MRFVLILTAAVFLSLLSFLYQGNGTGYGNTPLSDYRKYYRPSRQFFIVDAVEQYFQRKNFPENSDWLRLFPKKSFQYRRGLIF